MRVLENRTEASKREMDEMDALEEIKEINSRKENVDFNNLLEKLHEQDDDELQERLRQQEADDEHELQTVFSNRINRVQLDHSSNNSDSLSVSVDQQKCTDIKDTLSKVSQSLMHSLIPGNTTQVHETIVSLAENKSSFSSSFDSSNPNSFNSDSHPIANTFLVVKKRNIQQTESIDIDLSKCKKPKIQQHASNPAVSIEHTEKSDASNAKIAPSISSNHISQLFGAYNDSDSE
jgi:hypothetical protein